MQNAAGGTDGQTDGRTDNRPMHEGVCVMLICCWFVHVGPATQEMDVLERMMQAGMSVVRMNFSHGSYEVSTRCILRLAAWRSGQRSSSHKRS